MEYQPATDVVIYRKKFSSRFSIKSQTRDKIVPETKDSIDDFLCDLNKSGAKGTGWFFLALFVCFWSSVTVLIVVTVMTSQLWIIYGFIAPVVLLFLGLWALMAVCVVRTNRRRIALIKSKFSPLDRFYKIGFQKIFEQSFCGAMVEGTRTGLIILRRIDLEQILEPLRADSRGGPINVIICVGEPAPLPLSLQETIIPIPIYDLGERASFPVEAGQNCGSPIASIAPDKTDDPNERRSSGRTLDEMRLDWPVKNEKKKDEGRKSSRVLPYKVPIVGNATKKSESKTDRARSSSI